MDDMPAKFPSRTDCDHPHRHRRDLAEGHLHCGPPARVCRLGNVGADDQRANDEALDAYDRLLSSYMSTRQVEFWILTEWDRSVTTILLPSDY